MTRKKRKAPVKVEGTTEAAEVDHSLLQPSDDAIDTHATGRRNSHRTSPVAKVKLNGHSEISDLPEKEVDGDKNGNTLVDVAQLESNLEVNDCSYNLKNKCKIQLSKVKVRSSHIVDAIDEEHSSENSPSERYTQTVIKEGEDVVELASDDDNSVLKSDEQPPADLLQLSKEECENILDKDKVLGETTECVEQENEGTKGGVMHPSPPKIDANSETSVTGLAVKMETPDNEIEVKIKRRRPMETPEVFMCQLCHISFENPRDLTVHIRGHNEASSHTCNICSKKLSSASSLDRHMLIHSGERPFQCPMCEMSFTTNGNMNRHLRTHEKGQKDDLLQSKYDKTQDLLHGSEDYDYLAAVQCSPPKRPKLGSKQPHLLSSSVKSQGGRLSADDDLTCPVCHKTFICRFGLETHMTFHPDMKLNCVFCNLSFRSQRGLRMHLYKVHKKDNLTSDSVLYRSPESSPWKAIKGIDGVCFAEFSTKKFPHIAQVWCEENSPSVKGDDKSCSCIECKKIFPCMESLSLHLSSTHGDKRKVSISAVKENIGSKGKRKLKNQIFSQDSLTTFDLSKSSPKDNFMNALSLQPTRGECEDTCQRTGSPILNGILSHESKSAQMSSKLGKCAKQRLVNTDGLWKGFPVLDDISPRKEGRSGRPQPQSFSPLKAEMAIGAPKKPFLESDTGLVDGIKDVGPLSRRQDSEPISADVGVGMLTPAEFATANSHVDEDELERERALAEGSDLWNDRSSTKKCSHICKFCGKAFPFRSTLKVHVRSHMGLTPYKCMLCDYSSADKSTLVRHMRTHSGERPYSCKLCGFPFTTKANCERHVRKRHGKISKLDIDVNIQHHPLQRLPEQGQFSSPDTICRICNRDFKFFRDLQNHMRIHEKSPNKLYACVECSMNFAKKNQCVRHMLRKHRHLSSSELQQHVQSLSEKEEKAKEGKVLGKEDDLSTFKDLPFSGQTNLSGLPRPVPVYVNTGYQLYPTDVQDEPLDLSLPKNRSTPPEVSPNKPSTSTRVPQFGGSATVIPFSRENITFNIDGVSRYKEPYKKFYSPLLDALVCPHCLRLFKKGSRLKTHIRSHTKERPFRCSMCSAAFTQSSSLDEHMIRRHYEEEDPSLEQNEIKYGVTPMQIKLKHRDQMTSSILKNCLQPKDTQDMEVACSVGGKMGQSTATPTNGTSSDTSIELSSVSKMLAATDSNNFQQYMPSQIVRQTMSDAQLYQHSLNLTESSTKPSTADDSVFSHEGNLVIAENQESADVASEEDSRENGEDFETEELLKMSRSSKLESRQTCPYCQRKFPWVSSLRRHLITHTGLKPYECPHCGATFSTKSNCERHINRRHQGQKTGEEEEEMVQKDPFKCKECSEAAFSTRRKLQRHYREEHPMVSFPQEYMDAPDVIVNNKDLIEKIQQGYDPVLSPSVSGIIPEGTKKRNQLFFGSHSSAIKQEPMNHHLAEKSQEDNNTSVGTSGTLYAQKAERFPANQEVEYISSGREDASPFPVKDAEPKSIFIKQEAQLSPHPSSISALEYSSDLMSAESFSDQAVSEDDNGDNSEDESQVSGSEDQSHPSLVMMPSNSSSLVVPQVTLTARKGKKGARFNCDQCCKRFKTAQTLLRHLKVHQLEHPFKCTECTATFTTKFNCQRHIMKLHGKSKEEVMNITGTGKGSNAKIISNPSVNKISPKKMKVDPNSPLLVYSQVNATNVGVGRSVVNVSPKQRKGIPSSLPGKKNSKGKIKNLLPSVQYYDSLKTKSPSFLDNAGLGNVASFHSQSEGEGNGTVVADREEDVSREMGDEDSMNWKYHYTSSPGIEAGAANSSEGLPNESMESSGSGMVGEGSMVNSDIIKDLLGIQDSSTMDQLLESADSAAKILGVQS